MTNRTAPAGRMPGTFWQFRNAADGEAELLLYGDIASSTWWGDEVTPKQFYEDLQAMGDIQTLRVRINSGGGDVFAATAIGNALENHRAKVTAVIDGLCASAATIVACHCDSVTAAKDAIYMVHPVRIGLCDYVDAQTLKGALQALETIRASIVGLYARKTGRTEDEVAGWMDATSWWTAEAAMENGFIDALQEDGEPAEMENRSGALFMNGVDLHMSIQNLPESMQNRASRIADTMPGNPAEEEEEMPVTNMDELRGKYPELVDQLEREAAQRERKRIQDIEEMQMPGCEGIANEAKFINPVSAADFATSCLKELRNQGNKYLEEVKLDSQSSGAGQVVNQAPDRKATHEDDVINEIRKAGKASAGK